MHVGPWVCARIFRPHRRGGTRWRDTTVKTLATLRRFRLHRRGARSVAAGGDSGYFAGVDCAVDGLSIRAGCCWIRLRRDVSLDALDTSYAVPHAGDVPRFEDGH